MRRSVGLAVGISLLPAIARPQTPEDLELHVDCVPGMTAEVVVWGRWSLDGVRGWSWNLCHDPARASIGSCAVTPAPEDPCAESWCPFVACPEDLLELGPLFFHSVTVADGVISQGVVLPDPLVTMPGALPAQDRFEMLRISYAVTAEPVDLWFCDGRLDPPGGENVIVVGSVTFEPSVREGLTIPCEDLVGEPFLRGDVDQNGLLLIGDAVAIAKGIFGEGLDYPLIARCPDTADVNDDGRIDVADAVFILEALYTEGEPIPAPAAACGVDPTPDELPACADYPCHRLE